MNLRMAIAETRGLTKIYAGNIVALRDVSMSVPRGEIFALLGPNGAGKTTLFKVLLGIVRATSGETEICGLPSSSPESRNSIGYLPENHRFPDHLTGAGLLRLTGRLHGIPKESIESRIEELLDTVRMSRWASTRLKKYSKGMAQRIGLAQALMPDPDVLLLDEPTDGVDPVGRVEIRDVLRNLRSEGKTIFLNSHLLSEVESIADSVAILSGGRLIRMCSVDELTHRHCRFEIEADMSRTEFKLSNETIKIIEQNDSKLIVELESEDDINVVIDQLRGRGISIRSVVPSKVSLEESFIKVIGDDTGGVS